MSTEQEGQLLLFGAPRWQPPDALPRDVPDNLPGYLLVYLGICGGWVAREALAAAFWPRRTEDEALANLRANLYRVRELLSGWSRGDALHAEPRRVFLDLPTDVALLRAAVARADWPAAARLGADAPLASLSFRGFPAAEEWVLGQRRALSASWRDAALKAAPALAGSGDLQGASDVLLRLLHSEPSNEVALAHLLRLAGSAGRRDEALAAFDRCRRWLAEELQLKPAPDIAALAASLHSAASGGAGEDRQPAAAAVARPSVQIFGPPLLRSAMPVTFRPERRFQLLTVLAVRAGQWVGRDELAALLWPVQSTADARRNLRQALFKAREIAAAIDIEATEHALRWNVDTDLQSLQRALREQRFADAVPLRHGALAAGIDDPDNRAFSEWLAAERARADAAWRQAALSHLQALAEPAQRIAAAQALLQVDPFDDEAMGVLLAAEIGAGRRNQAQRLYREYAARLAAELGIEPPQRLRELLAERPTAAESTSPGDGTEFIGRRTELAEIALLIGQPDCRLLTILGPGGAGKSSLSRRALAQAQPRLPGAAVWVELQDLDEVASLPARLARQLGIDLNEAQDPLAQIAARLRDRRTLAVLDNAEHLSGLVALIDRLLEAAPSLTIVVTSRLRLHSRHERLLPLEGLAVPDEESRDLEAASAFDAVRLFDARARAAQRGFELARHLPAVIGIVDAVGGLPLAIELAAGWVRLLPPEEIARDLRDSIAALERDPAAAGAPARPEHGSVQAVLDRSWQLLAPREREAMMALSVFQGGFTHAAAREVAAVPLPVLSSLADRSMLKVGPAGRFEMHPLVAADAGRRAKADAARLAAIQERHAEHFAQHLADTFAEQPGNPRPIVDAVTADEANCLLAWRRAIELGRHDLVAKMHPPWRAYFKATGRFGQSVALFDEALALCGPPRLVAELRATLAYFLYRDRKPERAIALATETLAWAESLDDPELAQSSVATIAGCRLVLGQWIEARPWSERALELARRRGIRQEMAAELGNLALITTFLGEFERAIGLYEEAVAIQTELGNSASAARALCNLGFVHVARGHWARARQELEEALRYARERNVNSVAIEAEFLLGSVEVELGQLDSAQRRLEHAREGFRATRNAGFELKVNYYLARIAARRGDVDAAGRDLLAAVREARQKGWTYDVLYAAIFVAEVLAQRGCRREAALILLGIRAAPRSHAFVATLVDAGLRAVAAGPDGGRQMRPPPFDAIAERLAASDDLDEAIRRLRGELGRCDDVARGATNAGQTPPG